MTGYTSVTGDLFELALPAIGHGCNCLGVMGAGIAREFRRRFPYMYESYRLRCANGLFVPGDVFVWTQDQPPVVYNLATQPVPGPTATLDAIGTSVHAALVHAHARGITQLGIPWIGCGLGGLNKRSVATVLSEVAADSPVELIVVSLGG